jgi:hypothetical protein
VSRASHLMEMGCYATTRKWRIIGENKGIMDLLETYLHIYVDGFLWKYQEVDYKGQKYYLTPLGFVLHVAHKNNDSDSELCFVDR